MKMVAAATSLALAGGASAQVVLYDSLFIFDEGLFDRAFANCIGVPPPPLTARYDNQVCDDFTLGAAATITRVTADFTSKRGSRPSDGVWVQFYADIEGRPDDRLHAEFFASGSDFQMLDMGLIPDLPQYNFARRFVCDLSASPVELGVGRWWVSVQPVDYSSGSNGDWYWILRDVDQVIGQDMHARNGGRWHVGTPFGGLPGVLAYDTWTEFTTIGFGGPGTVSMRIEGFGGCAADFNGDGQVDFFDYLDFVSAFANEDPSADFNRDGQIDFFDYLDFVAAFAAGCD